ncbi:MAG: cell division topological specificity factor MinE [SAR202 cluster bacterium]|jgi:cell division topological specificity factor|nr:MAG: cell division topological specificity factor MinE [SAR202 cluster bacterium]MBH39430.1 cell division topological specificity factor MinE [Chloroflexota bacterium]MCH2527231.1 cell division topological specificity factor MinE [Dehalococcoidia bacterium]MQG80567.1 cell division topological specificity factor MinE [SAR202 cluster bacterium]|tara:strand:- start:353 stop:640 length:288 start_codon:yes stop_codon:yes gene_type:complete
MRELIKWVIAKRDQTRIVASKISARERLQMVLMRDRMDVSPDIMDALKNDMKDVMSRYLVVEDDFQEFAIHRSDESVFLVSNILVKELPRNTVTT